jgi:hypothetical protein
MPITWRGSTVTPQIQAMPPNNGNVVVFAIVNTFRSRCVVDILRLVCQGDSIEPPTGATANRVMPIMRARRCAAADVSGGVQINARPAWDTAIGDPDPGVLVLFDPGAYGGPDTAITAVNRGGPMWQQYTMRQASAIEQVLSQDNFMVPTMASSADIYLRPGEALVIEQQAPLNPTGGVHWFQVAWEEDQIDEGYVVGGTVNLSGSPVNGAKVLLVTDATTGMNNPSIETLTTGAPGTFSKTLASGVKAAVFVQHEAGGTRYSDEGKPFIEGP